VRASSTGTPLSVGYDEDRTVTNPVDGMTTTISSSSVTPEDIQTGQFGS